MRAFKIVVKNGLSMSPRSKYAATLVAAMASTVLYSSVALGEIPVRVDRGRGAAKLTRMEDFDRPPAAPCPADFQSNYYSEGNNEAQHDVTLGTGGCHGENNCAFNNNAETDHYHYVTVCDQPSVNYSLTTGCNIPSCHVETYAHRNGHSSFDLGAKIMMGDKTYRRADRVQKGDMLWNPMKNIAVRVRKVVIGFEEQPLLDLITDHSKLRVSLRHPMVLDQSLAAGSSEQAVRLTNSALQENTKTSVRTPSPTIEFGNYTVRQAQTLKPGDMVLGGNGEYHKLLSVNVLPAKPDQKVVNIELEGSDESPADHLLLSEGLVSGDYLMQLNLGGRDE